MGKKMLINAAHPEESRVALLENGVLEDLDIETAAKEQIKSNIYKGIVVKIEPSLQATFVDYGGNKAGFLSFSEIHPDYYHVENESRRNRPRIQEAIRRGQELLVQIVREERDNKGAALTTFISLPGRYMVLMPNSDSSGVSRKIEDEEERKKLRDLLKQLNVPEGMGCIVRTAGLGRTKMELAKDLNYLLRLWESIQIEGQNKTAPSMIYQESDLVIRTIRDYFTSDIREVLIDNKEVYSRAREFFRAIMPRYYRIVKLYREKKPLFSKYQLEEQIEMMYERKVPLKSGGSIVIDPTEALVAIDVNSGRSTRERSIEETAFKTNMEAAAEIARQLRLRDLGGLIVIDFIDMRDNKHIREVERCFRNAIKRDKAKIQFSRISTFGMMELSRQRLRAALREGSHVSCLQCQGTGVIKSVESFSLVILRKLQSAVVKDDMAFMRVLLPLEAAAYLLNNKREALFSMEKEFNVKIVIQPRPQLLANQYEIEFQRKEKPIHPEAEHEKVKMEEMMEARRGGVPETAPYPDDSKHDPEFKRVEEEHMAGEVIVPAEIETLAGAVQTGERELLVQASPVGASADRSGMLEGSWRENVEPPEEKEVAVRHESEVIPVETGLIPEVQDEGAQGPLPDRPKEVIEPVTKDAVATAMRAEVDLVRSVDDTGISTEGEIVSTSLLSVLNAPNEKNIESIPEAVETLSEDSILSLPEERGEDLQSPQERVQSESQLETGMAEDGLKKANAGTDSVDKLSVDKSSAEGEKATDPQIQAEEIRLASNAGEPMPDKASEDATSSRSQEEAPIQETVAETGNEPNDGTPDAQAAPVRKRRYSYRYRPRRSRTTPH